MNCKQVRRNRIELTWEPPQMPHKRREHRMCRRSSNHSGVHTSALNPAMTRHGLTTTINWREMSTDLCARSTRSSRRLSSGGPARLDSPRLLQTAADRRCRMRPAVEHAVMHNKHLHATFVVVFVGITRPPAGWQHCPTARKPRRFLCCFA